MINAKRKKSTVRLLSEALYSKRKPTMTTLRHLVMFHDLIHDLLPESTDITSKYEFQRVKEGKGRQGFVKKMQGAEMTQAFDLMKDMGYEQGVDEYHRKLCDGVSKMIIELRPEVGDEVWLVITKEKFGK